MTTDLPFILRSLATRKQYTLLIVLTLALGLGLTTAAYSVLHGRFLRGLPYDGAEHLKRIHKVDANDSALPVTLGEVEAWQASQRSLELLAAWQGLSIEMAVGGTPLERYNGAYVGPGVLELLRIQPQLGRLFTQEEHQAGAATAVLLGHSVWQERFGDRDPVGEPVWIYGQPATVVGVMPPGFQFPLRQFLWLPLRQSPNWQTLREQLPVQVVGKMQAGDADSAQRELLSLLPPEARTDGVRIRVDNYSEGYSDRQLKGQHVKLLALLVGLLVLCAANVANLMMTRTLARSRELALRASLGAPRWRLLGLVILEAVVLALGGGLLGLGVAHLASRGYLTLVGQADHFPFWTSVHLDLNVFLVALLASLGLGLVCGLIPALAAVRRDAGKGVVRGARDEVGVGAVRQGLVVAQIALCVALLLATALVVQSFFAMWRAGWGFQPDKILAAGLDLYSANLPDDAARLRVFDEVVHRLQGAPDVEALGWTYTLPGSYHRKGRFALDGVEYEEDKLPSMRFSVVTPGFFEVFGLRPLQGRLLAPLDRSDSEPVVLINAAFAGQYFPRRPAVGERIQISGLWRTVVGVVPDLLLGSIEGEDTEAVYLPLAQYPVHALHLVVRSRGVPTALVPTVRREVSAVVPDRPLTGVQTLPEILSEATRPYRASALVFSAMGLLALCLATMGLYANLSGFVLHKQRDIGVRMAIGAGRRRILAWVLGRGGLLLAIGLGLGLVLSLNLTQLMASFLYKMSPWAPGLFAGVAAAFALLGLAACLFPAVRASRLDPASLLRAE